MRCAAARTRSRVAGEISGWPFSALLTVATDTPHSFARSFRDGIACSPPSRRTVSRGDVLRHVLNRFRKFMIAHSARKIKRKRKSFGLLASLLAFCSVPAGRNCASRMVFVTFRLKSKLFSLSFSSHLILLLNGLPAPSFCCAPLCPDGPAGKSFCKNRASTPVL